MRDTIVNKIKLAIIHAFAAGAFSAIVCYCYAAFYFSLVVDFSEGASFWSLFARFFVLSGVTCSEIPGVNYMLTKNYFGVAVAIKYLIAAQPRCPGVFALCSNCSNWIYSE